MTDDLVAFLRAQLDDDESAALGAKGDTPGRWTQDDGPPEDIVLYDKSGKLTVGQARHIARHDPARVLREITADRQLLAAYVEAQSTVAAIAHPDMCDVGRAQGLEEAVRYRVLRFEGRAGYREEWRP
ncbi:DUF6221 family protein [Streptomyces sp. NPDC055025]